MLAGYGTGAIMAVPAHDERDFAFARQFGLPIRRVVAPPGDEPTRALDGAYIAHTADERLVNSGPLQRPAAPTRAAGRSSRWLAETARAEPTVTYRLRDWLISRQRYWGTPIPVIYCERDGDRARSPTRTCRSACPDTVDYRGSGENPLNHDEAFLHVDVPALRRPGPARDRHDGHVRRLVVVLVPLPVAAQGRTARSTATLVDRWTPVDQYTGGAEHAVMHLLYSRFFTKAMRDIGLVARATSRSSGCSTRARSWAPTASGCRKSRGNVQDPDELVARYGADTVRLFLMFMGPWDQGGPWSPTGIGGVHRFLNRVWTLVLDPHGREPGDPESGTLPAGETEAAAERAIRAGRPPDAARRHGRLRRRSASTR